MSLQSWVHKIPVRFSRDMTTTITTTTTRTTTGDMFQYVTFAALRKSEVPAGGKHWNLTPGLSDTERRNPKP